MNSGRIDREPGRFFDGGEPGGSPAPSAPLRVVLVRHVIEGVESFSLERAIGYDDRRLGRLWVPAAAGFRTDLTSVPWLFTWLVPRTGRHLPAALVHDGLVGGADGRASYVSERGHAVSREQADRVFRDAMADTGTGPVRRWLVWTAVTLATIVEGSASWSRAETWRLRLAAAVTLGSVLVLGTIATLDLFDVGARLPWMGDRVWWSELVGGFAGAITIPLLLGLAWGRLRVAGMVSGISLALLLHVSAALLLLTGAYQAAELGAKRTPRAMAVAGCAAAVVAMAGFAGYVL